MIGSRELYKRTALVAVAVGCGAALVVVAFHDWFHQTLMPALNITAPWNDAIGTFLVVMVGFASQHLISMAMFRDWEFGLARAQQEAGQRNDAVVAAAEQVADELRGMQGFNNVVRGQLKGVVAETEKAAFDIAGRLQGIDDVISRLGRYVESTTAESTRLMHSSEERIAQIGRASCRERV